MLSSIRHRWGVFIFFVLISLGQGLPYASAVNHYLAKNGACTCCQLKERAPCRRCHESGHRASHVHKSQKNSIASPPCEADPSLENFVNLDKFIPSMPLQDFFRISTKLSIVLPIFQEIYLRRECPPPKFI